MRIVIVARVIIRNQEGELLLLRRSADSGAYAGFYELPGGKCDPAHAADPFVELQREVQEETGVKLERGQCELVGAFSDTASDVAYFNIIYVCSRRVEMNEVKLSAEHDAALFIKEQELQQSKVTDYAKDALQKFVTPDNSEVDRQIKMQKDDKKTTNYETLIINTDGGSRGNPGPSASGYVIMDENEQVLEEGGEYLGITTNNQAEYQAVKLALEQARKYHPRKITFRIDSELVVKQMNGHYQIRNRDLWPVHAHIKELAVQFGSVIFTHVRREQNSYADAKVNEILDTHSNGV